MSNPRWLLLMCFSRFAFALIFAAYSAVLPAVISVWGMTAAQAGLIQSAWHIGYLLSLIFAGLLTDWIGARRTFLVMSIAACATGLVFALMSVGFHSALVLYFLTGVASGGSYTPGLVLIAQRFSANERGAAMGWYLAAASLGYAVVLFAAGILIPLLGWRSVLVLAAASNFAGALLGWVVLRRFHPATPGGQLRGSWAARFKQLWGNRPARLVIGSYSFHCWELLGLWAWLPAFLVAAVTVNGSVSATALAFGVTAAGFSHLASLIGSIAGGVLSDRLGRTRVILAMSCASLACSFSFGWLLGGATWLIVLVALVYNITAIADSPIFSTVLTEVVPEDYVGLAFSVRSTFGFGMGAISPWVFGAVLDWGSGAGTTLTAWGLAWCSLGIGALLGPFLTLRLHANQYPRPPTLPGGR